MGKIDNSTDETIQVKSYVKYESGGCGSKVFQLRSGGTKNIKDTDEIEIEGIRPLGENFYWGSRSNLTIYGDDTATIQSTYDGEDYDVECAGQTATYDIT